LAHNGRTPDGNRRIILTDQNGRNPSVGTSERRRRAELVGVRLLPGERAALEAAATVLGVSLGALLRGSALTAIGYPQLDAPKRTG
jgi:hypothetical protein